MWYPSVKGVCPGVAAHHTVALFSDRRVVSHPRLRRVAPLGRVQLPGANLAQVIRLAVRARPCEHRPPLWAAMTASLHSVRCESFPSYIFDPRSLDVSPAVQRWVVCLSGRCWWVSRPTVMAVRLLMVDAVLAGAGVGGVDLLKKSVVSRCLCAFCVHVQKGPEACVENALENNWFPSVPALSSPVIHSTCFPHLRLPTRKLFFSSFFPSLPKTSPSPSFLSVVSFLLLSCSC